jgi:hypothetical protein
MVGARVLASSCSHKYTAVVEHPIQRDHDKEQEGSLSTMQDILKKLQYSIEDL